MNEIYPNGLKLYHFEDIQVLGLFTGRQTIVIALPQSNVNDDEVRV